MNPEGLGFCLPIRFQTGSTLLKLAAKCKEIMSDIDFPFLIYHDPQDRVVLLGGMYCTFSSCELFYAPLALFI